MRTVWPNRYAMQLPIEEFQWLAALPVRKVIWRLSKIKIQFLNISRKFKLQILFLHKVIHWSKALIYKIRLKVLKADFTKKLKPYSVSYYDSRKIILNKFRNFCYNYYQIKLNKTKLNDKHPVTRKNWLTENLISE